MIKHLTWLPALLFMLAACEQQPAVQTLQAGKQLRKIPYSDAATLQQLREAGAEIVVQQPDYVIIRIDQLNTSVTTPVLPLTEADFIQRLVHISVADSGDLQKIVDTGVDLWDVEGDIAVARAYDLYIDKLREMGFTVTIIAADAAQPGEKE